MRTQTPHIALGPWGKDDGMQTQGRAGARFTLVRECFVRVVGAHSPVVPGYGSQVSDQRSKKVI